MTDKQNAERWKARYDWIEIHYAHQLMAIFPHIEEAEAIDLIRGNCEIDLKEKGFNYPFSEDEK